MIWLVRLYPRKWRQRYGDELEQLVRDLRPSGFSVPLAWNLVIGAVGVQLRREMAMNVVYRRTIGRVAAIVGVVGLALAVEILLTNVVFPSRTDNDAIPVLASDLCLFGALFLAGRFAARAGAKRVGQAVAGLVAGVLIGLIVAASFAIVDNVWLDVVAQQPSKMDGFAHSGAASMRDFINDGLVGVAVGLPLGLGFFGAVLGLIGGLSAGDGPAPAPVAAPGR